jgi:signal transduction histidine kinase
VHPEDRGRVRPDQDLRALRQPTDVVHRLRTPAGDERTVHLHVAPLWDDATDTLLVLQGTLQDVTALHRTERALQRVLTATNDGWFDEDVAADRASYSDRWWEIHGLTAPAGPLPAGVWRRFVPPEELPGIEARLAEAAAARALTLKLDGHVQHALGHLVPVVVRLSLEYDRDGRLSRVTGATSDVTEQVQAERAKDAFVSTVSHELRTPLTAIGGALELLAEGRGGPLPVAARPLLDIGMRNTDRLHALISDLLDIEQLRTGSIAMDRLPQRLAPILEDSVQDLSTVAEAAEVTLSLEIEDPTLEVRADATRLAQVATNLVSNAVKCAPAGTSVRLRVRRLGHRALVEVLDTGPGLPPSFRERAFERFAQADPEDPRSRGGTGLGLAISREIVHQHEGSIGYDSVPGDTRFWVELPLLGGAPLGPDA